MRRNCLPCSMWFVAALWIVAGVSSTKLQVRHGRAHRATVCKTTAGGACSACVIRAYLDTIDGVKLYELSWLKDEVLTGTLEACGKTVQILPRREFIHAHECLGGGGAVLVAMGAQRSHELEYIMTQPENVTRRMVVIHLSDETRSHDTTAYDRLAAVYRNYWREGLGVTYKYLLADQPSSAEAGEEAGSTGTSRVMWMPMGYGPNLLAHRSLVTALSAREWLFAWMGVSLAHPHP